MKTKLFKRLGATILALGMALSVMAIPTSAIGSDDTGSITVENVGPGGTVNAYQVMEVNYEYEPVDQPVDPVYVWTDSVATWLEEADNEYGDYINDADNAVTNDFRTATAEDLAAFYDALASYLTSQVPAPTISGSATNDSQTDNADVTISDLEMGNYLLLVTGGTRLYNPASATIAPYWDGDSWEIQNGTQDVAVDLKSSDPDVEKKADDTSVQIGQTVNFTITADVPQYPENATQKTFKIVDIMTSGLAYTETAPVVVGINAEGEETTLSDGDAYTYTKDGQSFTIELDYDKVSTYTKIEVTYSATVTADAVVYDDVTNTAQLVYDTNPYVDSDYETGGDKVDIYTYGIDVTKVDQNATETKLPGAEFTLTDSDTTVMKFVGTAGEYRVALADEEDATTTLITDADGKLIINGLAEDTYTLTETKAPDGYILPSNPETVVVINDEDNNGIAEGTFGDVNDTTENDEYVAGTIGNISESEGVPSLPTTGGMGTILFTTVGLVLVGGAAILLVVVYKRKKEN